LTILGDLAETFLDRIANATGQPPKTLSEEALRLLMTYHWPGNVRELENFIERAVALGSGSKLEPSDFPSHIDKDVVLPGLSSGRERMRRVRIPSIAEVERHAIFNAVAESNGDKLLAALYVRYRKNNTLSEAQTI
jgi:two-component system response regulator AtoC